MLTLFPLERISCRLDEMKQQKKIETTEMHSFIFSSASHPFISPTSPFSILMSTKSWPQKILCQFTVYFIMP